MRRQLFFVSAAAFALALCGSASAQKAGGYAGTSEDNNTISLTVTGTAGDFTIAGMSVGFTAACKATGDSVNEGWGFFLGQQIQSGVNDFTSGNDYYNIVGTYHFVNNNTIKGTITSRTAVFVPGATPPAKAMFCTSAKQGFTLTYQGPAAKRSIEPGTAITQH
jgi:hypothetical protein